MVRWEGRIHRANKLILHHVNRRNVSHHTQASRCHRNRSNCYLQNFSHHYHTDHTPNAVSKMIKLLSVKLKLVSSGAEVAVSRTNAKSSGTMDHSDLVDAIDLKSNYRLDTLHRSNSSCVSLWIFISVGRFGCTHVCSALK